MEDIYEKNQEHFLNVRVALPNNGNGGFLFCVGLGAKLGDHFIERML